MEQNRVCYWVIKATQNKSSLKKQQQQNENWKNNKKCKSTFDVLVFGTAYLVVSSGPKIKSKQHNNSFACFRRLFDVFSPIKKSLQLARCCGLIIEWWIKNSNVLKLFFSKSWKYVVKIQGYCNKTKDTFWLLLSLFYNWAVT